MTIKNPGTPWDDDRLAAAFAARNAAASAPAHLIGATIERFRRQPARPSMWLALRPVIALVAIATLAGSTFVALSPRRVTGPVPTSDASTASSIASGSTARASLEPERASGLPIISVTDAITIRDGGVDDREIAVRGWFSPTLSLAMFCPIVLDPIIRPVQLVCSDRFLWLTQDREATVMSGSTPSFKPPVGPALRPSFDQIDQGWMSTIWNPRSCGKRTVCPVGPVSIVAVGHFDDRRAALCAPDVAEQCRDRFVVDRLDSAGGVVQPLSVIDAVEGDQVWTVDEIERIEGEGAAITSISVADGARGLVGIEPSLAAEKTWAAQRAIWIVRRLVDGRAVTHVIADGSQRVYEVQLDGKAVFVRGPLPASHDAPWPPAGAILVTQSASQVVAVLDLSSTLAEARAGRPVAPPAGSRVGFRDLEDRWIRVSWFATGCEERFVLRIASTRGPHRLVTVSGNLDQGCVRAVLTGVIQLYTVDIRFDDPVVASDLLGQYETRP